MTFYKAKEIVKQGVSPIISSVIISSFAGAMLNAKLEALLALPILLVLVPSISDMTGNIGCMIGSKIATFLHLGLVRPRIERNPYLEKYVAAILVVAVLSSLYLTFLTIAVSYISGLGVVAPLKILEIVVITGVSVSIVATLVGIGVAFVTYKYGWDPDNTTIPIITAIGDVAGVAILLFVASITGLI